MDYLILTNSLSFFFSPLQPALENRWLLDIAGTGPDDFYAVGIMDAALLHCSHDPASGNMETEIIDLSDIWLLEN